VAAGRWHLPRISHLLGSRSSRPASCGRPRLSHASCLPAIKIKSGVSIAEYSYLTLSSAAPILCVLVLYYVLSQKRYNKMRRTVQIDFLIGKLFYWCFYRKDMQNRCIMKYSLSTFASHRYLIICLEVWCSYLLLGPNSRVQ